MYFYIVYNHKLEYFVGLLVATASRPHVLNTVGELSTIQSMICYDDVGQIQDSLKLVRENQCAPVR